MEDMLNAKQMIKRLAELPTLEERLTYWKTKASEAGLNDRDIDYLIESFDGFDGNMDKGFYEVIGYKKCCILNNLSAQSEMIDALYAVYFPEDAVKVFLV